MTKQELKQLKTATEKLTKWESSGKAFGHFQDIEKSATVTDKADKIYEFFCLMKLLEDLRNHYKISLKPGTKAAKIFPKAPASKKGWPYFEIENKSANTNRFQVCYGTNIKLSRTPKTTIAPDISIQKHDASDDPDENMVELIMDAKFKFNDAHALPVDQIHSFIQRVTALETKLADTIALEFDKLRDIKSNCLLTNGKALKDQLDYCVEFKIKQVEHFDSKGKAYDVIG